MLFLTFCGIMMVAYTSVVGGGFLAGYWHQDSTVLDDSEPSGQVNMAMYSVLTVQNFFYVPTNAYILFYWYKHQVWYTGTLCWLFLNSSHLRGSGLHSAS